MSRIMNEMITILLQVAKYFATTLLFVCLPMAACAGMIRDTELETGLQKLMAPLVAAAGYSANSIAVRIIIDPSYNAFVAGKQIIYINSGLLLNANSAEEIIGVMAHEIGHLKAGHVPRRDAAVAVANSANALTALAAIAVAAGGGGDAAAGVLIGGQDQVTRKLLQTIRYDEAVADEIGLYLLEKAGITADGLRDMMQRMAAQRALPESRQSRYYQTHPDAAERLRIYQDHVSRQTEQAAPISNEMQALVERLETKLRAYVEPPKSVLAQFDDAGALTHLYAKSIALYRRGELESALTVIEDLIEMAPQDAFFHEFHGDVLLSMAKPDAAAQAYELATSIRPDSPQILINYGRALIASGKKADLTNAISALEQARDGEPKWAFAYRQLAIAYGRAGRLADADITLADEALMAGDRQRAIKMAKRSLSHGSVRDEIQNRANDILYRYGAPKE
jgi:predicted Zn-dependent protease